MEDENKINEKKTIHVTLLPSTPIKVNFNISADFINPELNVSESAIKGTNTHIGTGICANYYNCPINGGGRYKLNNHCTGGVIPPVSFKPCRVKLHIRPRPILTGEHIPITAIRLTQAHIIRHSVNYWLSTAAPQISVSRIF